MNAVESRGTAVLALEALGHKPAAAALGAAYEPNPERHERYQAALDHYQKGELPGGR